jgi:polyhydroxyalkanoate synthesis repressor PhaR
MKRIIKKYPNRRLYDTELSRYITFEDVKDLVLRHIPFQVIDAKTQEDLTNNALLQIVLELEQKGAPIFTSSMLEQLICFYGNDFQKTFSDFLEKSFSLFQNKPSTDLMPFWKNFQDQWQDLFNKK